MNANSGQSSWKKWDFSIPSAAVEEDYLGPFQMLLGLESEMFLLTMMDELQ